MNSKLLLKTLFLIAILLLLVIMGMNNRATADLSMAPLFTQVLQIKAAFMYFGFFAIGVLTGTILTAGRKGGGGGKSKSD